MMKVRIVDHFNKASGRFIGYEIQFKPFWWWPVWLKVNEGRRYSDEEHMHNDVLYLLARNGVVKYKSSYD